MREAERNTEQELTICEVQPGLPPTRATEQRLLIQEATRLGLAFAGGALLFLIVIVALLRAASWEET